MRKGSTRDQQEAPDRKTADVAYLKAVIGWLGIMGVIVLFAMAAIGSLLIGGVVFDTGPFAQLDAPSIGGPSDKEQVQAFAKEIQSPEKAGDQKYDDPADYVHPDAPNREALVTAIEEGFRLMEEYDLEYDQTILNTTVGDELANVRMIQETRGGGDEYPNNRVKAVFTMRTHEGDWLLYDMTILEAERLPGEE